MIANASELTSEAFALVPPLDCCSLLQPAAAFPSIACCGPRFQTALSSLWFCSSLHQSGSRLPQLWACQKLVAPKPAA